MARRWRPDRLLSGRQGVDYFQQSTKIVESGARSIAFNSGKQEDVPFNYQLLALAAVPLNGLSQQSLWAVRKAFDWAVTKKNFMVVMIRYLKILKQINCL